MLRAWRDKEQLSVNAAARRLGVGWKEYTLWEQGKGRRPGLDAAFRIQKICGIALEAWMPEDPPADPRSSLTGTDDR